MASSVSLTPLPYLVAPQRFGDRLRKAILDYQSQIGRKVGYAELGVAIAKHERRKSAYTASAVSEWISGRSNPGPETIAAIALTLGVTTDSLLIPSDVPRADAVDVARATEGQITAADELLEGTREDLRKQAGAEKRRVSGGRKRS